MFCHRSHLPLLGLGLAALLPQVSGAAPVSRAGATFLAYPGDTIVLDGTASEGEELAWRWVQIGGPRVPATGTDTARPRFRADIPGRYTFELVVREGEVSAAPDTVDVVVADPEIATRYDRDGGCSQLPGRLGWAWCLPLGLLLAYRQTRS